MPVRKFTRLTDLQIGQWRTRLCKHYHRVDGHLFENVFSNRFDDLWFGFLQDVLSIFTFSKDHNIILNISFKVTFWTSFYSRRSTVFILLIFTSIVSLNAIRDHARYWLLNALGRMHFWEKKKRARSCLLVKYRIKEQFAIWPSALAPKTRKI